MRDLELIMKDGKMENIVIGNKIVDMTKLVNLVLDFGGNSIG